MQSHITFQRKYIDSTVSCFLNTNFWMNTTVSLDRHLCIQQTKELLKKFGFEFGKASFTSPHTPTARKKVACIVKLKTEWDNREEAHATFFSTLPMTTPRSLPNWPHSVVISLSSAISLPLPASLAHLPPCQWLLPCRRPSRLPTKAPPSQPLDGTLPAAMDSVLLPPSDDVAPTMDSFPPPPSGWHRAGDFFLQSSTMHVTTRNQYLLVIVPYWTWIFLPWINTNRQIRIVFSRGLSECIFSWNLSHHSRLLGRRKHLSSSILLNLYDIIMRCQQR
jgi:hypothetical protein